MELKKSIVTTKEKVIDHYEIEEGVSLDDRIAMLEQAIYEMTQELCLDKTKEYTWCK